MIQHIKFPEILHSGKISVASFIYHSIIFTISHIYFKYIYHLINSDDDDGYGANVCTYLVARKFPENFPHNIFLEKLHHYLLLICK